MADRTQTPRIRYARHRTFKGADRGASLGEARLKGLDTFLNRRSDTAANGGIGDTATPVTFTADNSLNELTSAAHGLATGDGPFVLSNAGGALPVGLNDTTLYWVSVVGPGTLQLHTTREDAGLGTNVVDFATDGTGTNSYELAADRDGLKEYFYQGVSSLEMNLLTDIDDVLDHF